MILVIIIIALACVFAYDQWKDNRDFKKFMDDINNH